MRVCAVMRTFKHFTLLHIVIRFYFFISYLISTFKFKRVLNYSKLTLRDNKFQKTVIIVNNLLKYYSVGNLEL